MYVLMVAHSILCLIPRGYPKFVIFSLRLRVGLDREEGVSHEGLVYIGRSSSHLSYTSIEGYGTLQQPRMVH